MQTRLQVTGRGGHTHKHGSGVGDELDGDREALALLRGQARARHADHRLHDLCQVHLQGTRRRVSCAQ